MTYHGALGNDQEVTETWLCVAAPQSLQEGTLTETVKVKLRFHGWHHEFRDSKNHSIATKKDACIKWIWPYRGSHICTDNSTEELLTQPLESNDAMPSVTEAGYWVIGFGFSLLVLLSFCYFGLIFLIMSPSPLLEWGCLLCTIVCWKYITCLLTV